MHFGAGPCEQLSAVPVLRHKPSLQPHTEGTYSQAHARAMEEGRKHSACYKILHRQRCEHINNDVSRYITIDVTMLRTHIVVLTDRIVINSVLE